MVNSEYLCNKLYELSYSFKRETGRVRLFGRGTDRVTVPKKKRLDDDVAVSILRQAGVSEIEIDKFMRAAKA